MLPHRALRRLTGSKRLREDKRGTCASWKRQKQDIQSRRGKNNAEHCPTSGSNANGEDQPFFSSADDPLDLILPQRQAAGGATRVQGNNTP